LSQLTVLSELYPYWNLKINVISRKDIDNLEIHHILHSLSIGKIFSFIKGTKVLDAGTGGGFPGIPLAILFPEVEFTLVDSIAKKIRVVEEIKSELELKNVNTRNERFENTPGKFDYITGRAVSSLPDLCKMLWGKILDNDRNKNPNGMIYLKGGEFTEELKSLSVDYKLYNLSDYYSEPFFETKKLIHISDFG
jgi:16S rRNA (guanine527-N7)-methyltransferase